MGKRARLRQERLPEKLRQIRERLGLSQSEILRALGFEDLLDYKRISEYELGDSEPPLRVILAYSRLAKIPMETLVDDELDLPVFTKRTLKL